MRTADFVISLRVQVCEDQVAVFIGDQIPPARIAERDDKCGRPLLRACIAGREIRGGPEPVAIFQIQAAKLSHDVDAVDMPVTNNGRAHQDVQRLGFAVGFAGALP